MTRVGTFARVLLISSYAITFRADALAADITGVWATNGSNCDKMFVKKASTVSFTNDSDLYGDGLIIDGRRITGKSVNCDIKSIKEEGSTVHMIAACATSIMRSSGQSISVRVVDQNRIIRVYPGVSDISISYDRCVLK